MCKLKLSAIARIAVSSAALCSAFTAPANADDGVKGSFAETALVSFSDMLARNSLSPDLPGVAHVAPSPAHRRPGIGAPAGKGVAPSAAVVQRLSYSSGLPSPAPSANFLGTQDDGWIPPDTQGAVGPNHLVITINGQVKIQDRSGNAVSSVSLASFWAAVNPGDFVFDPRVHFDANASRWITIAAARASDLTHSYILVGASTSSDPTGSWRLYKVSADPSNSSWADFPNLGLSDKWIAVSANMFPVSTGSIAAKIFVFGKSALYAGSATPFTIFNDSAGYNDIPTVALDRVPNASSRMYLVNGYYGSGGAQPDHLRISEIKGAIGSETISFGISTPTSSDTSSNGGVDDPQLGALNFEGGNPTEIRAVVRNGFVWCVQKISLPTTYPPGRSSIQWWQVVADTGQVIQLGRVDDPAAGGSNYDYPSIAVNANNDVMVGYSVFSSTSHAGAGYAMRYGTDAPNTIRQPVSFKAGENTYFKDFGTGRNRWGDYSATVVDPLNDMDMWTLQEYAATPANTWGLWWAKISLPPTPPVTVPNIVPTLFYLLDD